MKKIVVPIVLILSVLITGCSAAKIIRASNVLAIKEDAIETDASILVKDDGSIVESIVDISTGKVVYPVSGQPKFEYSIFGETKLALASGTYIFTLKFYKSTSYDTWSATGHKTGTTTTTIESKNPTTLLQTLKSGKKYRLKADTNGNSISYRIIEESKK